MAWSCRPLHTPGAPLVSWAGLKYKLCHASFPQMSPCTALQALRVHYSQVGSIAGEWTRVVARSCGGDAQQSATQPHNNNAWVQTWPLGWRRLVYFADFFQAGKRFLHSHVVSSYFRFIELIVQLKFLEGTLVSKFDSKTTTRVMLFRFRHVPSIVAPSFMQLSFNLNTLI